MKKQSKTGQILIYVNTAIYILMVLGFLVLPVMKSVGESLFGYSYIKKYSEFEYKLSVDPVTLTILLIGAAVIIPLFRKEEGGFGISFLFLISGFTNVLFFRDMITIKATRQPLKISFNYSYGYFVVLGLIAIILIIELLAIKFILAKPKPIETITEKYCERCEFYYDKSLERCPNCYWKERTEEDEKKSKS